MDITRTPDWYPKRINDEARRQWAARPTIRVQHRLMRRDHEEAGGPFDEELDKAYQIAMPIAQALGWNDD